MISLLRRPWVLPARTRNAARAAALLACLALGGCHTTSDGNAVASQLASTAAALANYYTAIQTETVDSVELNDLEQGVWGIPLDQQEYAMMMDTEAELQRRIEMANDLSTLAASLTQLTASTGASDAATAAGKLASVAASITQLSSTSTALISAGLGPSVQDIVTAIQARRIRESASQIAAFLNKFNKQFTSEESFYTTLNDQYAGLTTQLSTWLVTSGQTDPAAYSSALAKMALAPYGLTAKLDAATTAKIASTAQLLIGQRSSEMKTSQVQAGKAMENALAGLAARMDDVAANKPLPNGITPPDLAIVNRWASSVSAASANSTTPSASTATPSASSSAPSK